MKKIVMIAFCLISVKYAFAQDEILWASIGGAFTALVEEDSLWKASAGAGMTFDAYIFPNVKNRKTSNIGFFLQGMLGAGFSMERPNRDIYGPLFQAGLTLGPSFKRYITDRLAFLGAVGVEWLMIGVEYHEMVEETQRITLVDFQMVDHHLGVGSDIGLKYDITNALYIGVGAGFSWGFLHSVELIKKGAKRQEPLAHTQSDVVYRVFMMEPSALIAVKLRIVIGMNM